MIHHQCHNNWQWERNGNRVQADYDRIFDCHGKLIRFEERYEVLHADPLTSHNTKCRLEILKGNDDTVHWVVGKDQENDDRRKHQQI